MKNKLLAFFKKNTGISIKPRELAKRLDLYEPYEYDSLKAMLHQLVSTNVLIKIGKRFQLNVDKTDSIVGKISISKKGFGFVINPDKSTGDIFVTVDNLNGAQDGDKVKVKILEKSNGKSLEGKVISIIQVASPKKQKTINKKIAVTEKYYFKKEFDKETLEEAEKISAKISKAEIRSRLDYRDKVVFTIDPDDAKDFDDALSIEELENGNYSVGVHIADVSHYVPINSSLDQEAYLRGNSIYLVDGVVPMLPEILSTDICSLVPFEDRLTYSVIIELTRRGKIENYTIKKTVINSKRRFTYEEAQNVIETKEGDFADELLQLNSLAQTLRKKRIREGSIDFFTDEVKFILDESGKPIDFVKREIKDSNKLIEEYMLLANKIVAQEIALPKKGEELPFIYRVHDLPDKEKLAEFAKFVKSLGYTFNLDSKKTANKWQQLMEAVKGSEEETIINELAIRSMSKAIYSANNIGHYGLGFRYYTHFTSPIRRYSDLIVHRMLFSYLEKKKRNIYSYKQLDEIGNHISETERTAMEAERYSVKLAQVEYLSKFAGEEFHGIISGVTSFGLFVKITHLLAEGLIRMQDLDDDYYILDQKNYSLVGRRTKKKYRLGDKVNIKLIRVDTLKSELDFIILE